jgi:membrane dipeptidase
MAEVVGVDHVSIGTDQFDARGCVEDYTRWVHLVAAMLHGGFTAAEAADIACGNYMRIFPSLGWLTGSGT